MARFFLEKVWSPFQCFFDSNRFKVALIVGCSALGCYFFSMRNRKKIVADNSCDTSPVPKSEESENDDTASYNLESDSSSIEVSYNDPDNPFEEEEEESDLSDSTSIPGFGTDTEDDVSDNILDED